MDNKYISIIIPVYNSKKYLPACIDSILNQTYSNFELLLMDDGSSDESLKICNDFKEKDGRIKVFHHENHGVSYTRNRGISLSSGDYITFIDADDFILPHYLEKLLKAAYLSSFSSKTISFCRFYDLIGNNEMFERVECYDNLKSGKCNLSLSIDDLLSGKLFGSICRMLIPSVLVKSNNIFFSDCRFKEDQLFLFDLINCADAFVECDEFLYIYRYNLDSASRKRYVRNLIIDQSKYLNSFIKKLKTYPLDDATTQQLFEYAVLDVKILWLINATKSDAYYKEIKTMKSTEYFSYPISDKIENKWRCERGKTNNIVLTLANRKMYFAIYCILKIYYFLKINELATLFKEEKE